ncbi:MAG: M20/M25/M40 family metallo-hydrolase [Parvularculaceae bacterium]|nr:M20/M25/M40 family metallo-hydrolase [Parvularculaceae bacterium]
MRVMRYAAASFLFAAAACASAPEPAATAEDRIRADVAFLADDQRTGREPGTKGYDAAADYVVKRMKAAGLKPASKAGWRQDVPMRSSVRVIDAARFSVSSASGAFDLAHLDDFLLARAFDAPSISVSGPLVYVGYGVVAPEDGVDDYRGLDVAGKIVVAFDGAPPAMNTEKRAYYSSGDVKRRTAEARGAIGFVSIMTKAQAEKDDWDRYRARALNAVMAWLRPDGSPHSAAPGVKAVASLSAPGAEKLFVGERADYAALQAAEAAGEGAPEGFALSKTATLAGAYDLSDLASANVIGVIEGADPSIRDEVILLTAHLDHIGVSRSAKPGEDAINNGALDNAGGVATLIEAARLFVANGERPRRTIAFVALTGEETGLLGSDYLARYPAFGGKKVVANINLDMPIALYPFTDVIAFGAERSSLGPVVAEAAASMGLALSPDPMPEENIFIRSDHYSFVKQGAPAVFLVPGFANGGAAAFEAFLKDRYHRPSDDVAQPIDYAALARFTELNVKIARALANGDETPAWIEGDFFGEMFAR